MWTNLQGIVNTTIADVPSLVSGPCVAFIDPHEQLYRKERTRGRPTSSYKWEMKEHREDMAAIPDQWQPYKHKIFHLGDEEFHSGKYQHTLFRFPLRTTDNYSELSNTCYTPAKILKLFQSLEIEGHLDLLFLQHLESIEIYHKTENSSEALLLFSVHIAPKCIEEVRKQRKFLQQAMVKKEDKAVFYTLDIEISYGSQIIDKPDGKHSYLVCQYYGQSGDKDHLAASLGHLPLVGVALPLTEKDVSVSQGGHLFCFLPFPLEKTSPTGLNVHVNGYFAVDQNRRHLKWPPADQKDDIDDKALLWNIHLVENLLPSALCMLVAHAAKLVKQQMLSQQQVSNTSHWHLVMHINTT